MTKFGTLQSDEPPYLKKLLQQSISAQSRVDSLDRLEKEFFLRDMEDHVKKLYHEVSCGYELLLRTTVMLQQEQDPGYDVKSLFPSAENIQDHISEKILECQGAFYRAIGFSDEAMATLYVSATYLLNQSRFEEARLAFGVLVLLASYVPDFWTGHGFALFEVKRFSEAIESLEAALSLDPNDTQPLLILCRALVKDGKKTQALMRLQDKIDRAGRYGDLHQYEILENARFELSQFDA